MDAGDSRHTMASMRASAPSGQCGLFLGPLGFKGRTFGQAPGFMLPSECLSTKAIRSRVSCRNGPASSNPDQGSNLRRAMQGHRPW